MSVPGNFGLVYEAILSFADKPAEKVAVKTLQGKISAHSVLTSTVLGWPNGTQFRIFYWLFTKHRRYNFDCDYLIIMEKTQIELCQLIAWTGEHGQRFNLLCALTLKKMMETNWLRHRKQKTSLYELTYDYDQCNFS